MGKKRVASAYISGQNYKKLVGTVIQDNLVEPSDFAFPLSSNIEDNMNLTPRQIYTRIIEGTFLLTPPEKTKTVRNSVSQC